MVGILRPATLSLRLGWIDLKKVRTAMSASCLLNVISNSVCDEWCSNSVELTKILGHSISSLLHCIVCYTDIYDLVLLQVLLFHLEEAGLRYIPQKNGFREVESTGPPRPRCAKMGLKRPKSQPSTTGPATPVHVHTSQATTPQTVVLSQSAPAGGVVTMNNATEAHTERVCVPEQQQSVPVSNSIQGSVPLDAQAILMPHKDENHQTMSESQNHMMYQLESSVDGTCGNENKTALSSSETEMTTVSAQKSLDGSIDTADSSVKREKVAMDTEAQLSSEKVTESKNSQSADTTVVPTATAITEEHAITEEESVQVTVKTTEESGSSQQGQEMGNITDQKDDLDTSEEKTASNKPVSPKPSIEQQRDNSELLTDADSTSSAAETSQNTEVAKSGPPLGSDSGTAESSNYSNTAKAETDINTDSNTSRESSNILSSKSEEMSESSEKPEEKTLDAKVEESSGESSISGISETIKQQQQQQPSLVPYENEDSSSSNEATNAQNGARASTVETTSSNKEFSEADEQSEIQAQKQDEGTSSDIVTEDQPGENNQSDETKADVDKGAINSEGKDISGKDTEIETLPEESNMSKNSEGVENVEAPKDETIQNVTAHEEESYDSNDRTQGSETIAGDAIKQQQQVETTESQSKEGSEVKIAIDAECANGQVTAETKLASSEQLTGDNSTQPAIFSTENQMSEENKPQVNAEMVDNNKSQAAESRLLLTTGALAGQGNTSDTTGETTPSPSQVQTLTSEVDTEVTPVVNNHQSEQVSLALLVFFSELLFNFSTTSPIDNVFHPLKSGINNYVLRLITVTWCFF